ncbi:hypothetical protein P3S68_017889 [Capsicum galapagoense]
MGSAKPKRVSWASGPNLCQVKLFLEEDCPSKVGWGSQHHLQLKRTPPSIIRKSSEGRQCLKQSKEKLSYLSLAKWKCPPKFNLDAEWRVVAGEESKEAEDQEHREKRVSEVVYPSRSTIPPNPYISSDLKQYYDDNQTPVIRITPIEEADVEAPFHLTPPQTISSKSPGACLPNSPSSSVSIVTSQKLPDNGKSVPQSLSTFPNPKKLPSNSPFSVRWPYNVQSASPYLSKCPNLKGSSETQVSPKPPVSYNSVSQCRSTFKNLSTPEQTEIFPVQPANQNLVPKYRTVGESQEISQKKSQVSGKPPANYNPVTQFPSTCKNPDQTEIFPDQPANQKHAPKYQTLGESQEISQKMSLVSGKPPANRNLVTQSPSTCENPNQTKIFPDQPANENHAPKYQTVGKNRNTSQVKSQVSGEPPANHNPVTQFPQCENPSIPDFDGDLTVAVAVAALANTQEQSSLIDTDLLVKLLLKPEELQKLMSARGLATDSKPDKVINKPINEYQVPHTGSGPIFGPKPMAKSVPLMMTKPETSVKSNLANEQGLPPHAGIANIRGSKPLVHPTSDLNLEKIKKLINEYGAPNHVGGKPLANSELVPSSRSKYDVVLSSAHRPTTLQPELPVSLNSVHTSPLSSMTSPAPLHKDINYYKSLIKQHGQNYESVVDERLQSINPRGNTRGPGLLNNQNPNQRCQTPCAFFNRPKGCLKGSACLFLHDMPGQKRSGGVLEAEHSKRMR